MNRTVTDIRNDARLTQARMDRLASDIATALMNGWVADAQKYATGLYADLYRKRSELWEEMDKAREQGRG